jgi:hypothetical protein
MLSNCCFEGEISTTELGYYGIQILRYFIQGLSMLNLYQGHMFNIISTIRKKQWAGQHLLLEKLSIYTYCWSPIQGFNQAQL